MSNDGTGLREAVLAWWKDHEYDCVPGRDGDIERNVYDEPPAFVKIALSAVAPPPVLEGMEVVFAGIPLGEAIKLGRRYAAENEKVRPRLAQVLESLAAAAASPAAPAQPEGGVVLPPRKSATDYVDEVFGRDDLAAVWNACRNKCEQLNARPAPAQQAVTDSARLDWLERVGFTTRNRDGRERVPNVHSWVGDDGKWKWTAAYVGSEFPTARAAIDAALASNAAASAADAQAAEGAK